MPMRYQQPQAGPSAIDWANPFARGLVVGYNGGIKYDAVAGRGSTKSGTVSSTSIGRNKGVTLGTTSSYESFVNAQANVTGAITVLAFGQIANTSADATAVSKNNANGAAADPTPFDFGVTTGGTASIGKVRLARSNSGGYRVWSSVATFAANADIVIGARQSGNISASPNFFINGIKDAGAAVNLYSGAGTGAAGSNVYTVKVANRGDVGTYWNGGAIYAAFVWNRELSDAEIKAISANPWQLFKGAARLFKRPAGSGVSLAIADATHGHLADNLSFSMATYLAVQDATHSHTTDGVALTTSWLLSIAEALHSHAADSLTLGVTGATNLSVQEATHAHLADAVTLTTRWLLTIADSLHAHAADNVVLNTTSGTFLTVQDATHNHSADGLALSLSAWLAIVEAAHAHSAESPTLSLGQTSLHIAEALHAMDSDSVFLSLPGGALTPDQKFIVRATARRLIALAVARNNIINRRAS